MPKISSATAIAIASPAASFIQAFSKIGLIPDAGGTWFLIKKLGLARAMGAAMLGDTWEWDGATWTQFVGTLPLEGSFNIATDLEMAALASLGREKFLTSAEMDALPAEQREKAQQAVYEVVQDKARNFLQSAGQAQ